MTTINEMSVAEIEAKIAAFANEAEFINHANGSLAERLDCARRFQAFLEAIANHSLLNAVDKANIEMQRNMVRLAITKLERLQAEESMTWWGFAAAGVAVVAAVGIGIYASASGSK